MLEMKCWRVFLCLCFASRIVCVAGPVGLMAEWSFDEGKGDVAHDGSGNGHDAKIHGATWVKQGDGFALSLNGKDNYLDCGESRSLGITGPITVEAWVRPMRKGKGEAVLIGEGVKSYLLTYYNLELCYFYIGSGGNNVRGKLTLGQWNHVAATFDGKLMSIWINGKLAGHRESKFKSYKVSAHSQMGTPGRYDVPKFKGMLDKVRFYNRALSGEEVVAHFKKEAAGFPSLPQEVVDSASTTPGPALSVPWKAGPDGLLADWSFDEGKGDVAHDGSGNGHNAKIHGATWVKQGDSFAVSLDGEEGYIDCGECQYVGPVTVEAWVRPMRKAHGEAALIGKGMRSFLLTYYNGENCYWYIGSGGNNVRGKLTLGQWNHVAATFDGKLMSIWINGRQTGYHESKIKNYEAAGRFVMGTQGRPDLAKFKGMLDKVRVYNRGLTGEEVVAHFKAEAGKFGYDPTWFSRVKVKPYYYLNQGEVVVEADYVGLQPLQGKGKLEVTLSNKKSRNKIIQSRSLEKLPESGLVEVKLPCGELRPGTYVIRVSLRDSKGTRPAEELTFSYPAKTQEVPSPVKKTVAPLPPESRPTPFAIKVGKGGGFRLTIKEASYPFVSRISWPKGEFNHLVAGDVTDSRGEKSWNTSMRAAGEDRYEIEAEGNFYTIQREIRVLPTHVYIKDTYINTTGQDLGLLIYNEMPVRPGQITESKLGGFEGRRRASTSDTAGGTNFFSPSVFLTDKNTGLGIVPIDDVFIVQSVLYAEPKAAGLGTEKFALAPKKSYTLEWAVYPTGSRDYYDFINNFRKVEGRISTIEGAPGFITHGPMNRRQVPDKEFIEKRGIKYGLIHCLSGTADDPGVSIEGIEFVNFPREMALLKKQAAAIHEKHPGFKTFFHIAHSLYVTNNPDKFADSKVILSNGRQAMWDAYEPYISRERIKEGWKWWIYYPTPGNSFHDAMLKSVDIMMDEIGMDGAFMDGFLAGYKGMWTYDGRWDGHSADIDLQTKTITRKVGSVLLLSQPSLIEFCRKIRDKGGIVVANNTMMTRSICNEKYIIHDYEVASGPHLHLAPSVIALANPTAIRTEKDVYFDMLDKLSWGELFAYYNVRIDLTYPSLASKQFPMTFEEIRSGLVRGKERIVTMNSGVYGWPGEQDLHIAYKFDGRGAPASHDFITTVDRHGVRTELRFGENESAVIEPIPVVLETGVPVNTRVIQYDTGRFRILLNGLGKIALRMRSGEFPVKAGATYRVTAGRARTKIAPKDGMLFVPLRLDGQVEVAVERADRGE